MQDVDPSYPALGLGKHLLGEGELNCHRLRSRLVSTAERLQQFRFVEGHLMQASECWKEAQCARNEPCGDTLRCAATPQLFVHDACTFGRFVESRGRKWSHWLSACLDYSFHGSARALLSELLVLAFTGMVVHGRSTRHDSI